MQIVIPMSGFGERFKRVGFKVPKPLIEIDGKPIISYVIDMFPGEKNLIFICNEEHLEDPTFQMELIIKKYCPTAKIVGIKSHKLGPVYAVSQIEELLYLSEPIVVNYCDFTCYWDWQHFKTFVKDKSCIGAIPAYKGFHPHSLGNTNYAYMLEKDGWVKDIKEKEPFTENRMGEYASSGTYYFSSARVMLDAFSNLIEKNLNVGGEYYVSLSYKHLLDRKQSVAVYPIQHFMQWGTPEDLAEYQRWSNSFRSLIKPIKKRSTNGGTVIVPMGGMGKRFSDEGYDLPKPLITVSGLPMVIQATYDLPPTDNYVFVIRKDMPGNLDLEKALKERFPKSSIMPVDHVTDGQAITAEIGIRAVGKERTPIIIGACDNGALYDMESYDRILNDPSVDIIVWGVRGYPNAIRNPQMFGWISADDNGLVDFISVKKAMKNPEKDPIVIGTFTFRRSNDFHAALNRLTLRNGRINGEFYIDALINDAIESGLKCHLFEVDNYLCWGTPNELKTFEYWQSCFHKWDKHPYALSLDNRVPNEKLFALEKKYQTITPYNGMYK